MTDQDPNKDEEPGKAGLKPADGRTDGPTDVEGHGGPKPRVADDDDDVEGHFSTIRSTGTKGD